MLKIVVLTLNINDELATFCGWSNGRQSFLPDVAELLALVAVMVRSRV
jgi:hypothetical protein